MVLEILVGIVLVGFLRLLYKNNKKDDLFPKIETICKRCGYEKGLLKCPYCRE